MLAAESPQGDGDSGVGVRAIGAKRIKKERKIASQDATVGIILLLIGILRVI